MPRFLSSEWFDAVRLHASDDEPGNARPDHHSPDRLLLEQVVTGTPDGTVRYVVVVEKGSARLLQPGAPDQAADLILTTDWDTAAAIAKGELATQAALMQGRLRVRGNLAKLAGRSGDLGGLDPMPQAVRKTTTY